MSIEILLFDQLFERIAIAYAADLKLLGISAAVRTIDTATYERRLAEFRFRHGLHRLSGNRFSRHRAKRLLGLRERQHTRQQ